jgi:hypothetical protein
MIGSFEYVNLDASKKQIRNVRQRIPAIWAIVYE